MYFFRYCKNKFIENFLHFYKNIDYRLNYDAFIKMPMGFVEKHIFYTLKQN